MENFEDRLIRWGKETLEKSKEPRSMISRESLTYAMVCILYGEMEKNKKMFKVSIPTGVGGVCQIFEASRIIYSHRNGETDDPEIDGWYFIEWGMYLTVGRNPCQNPNNDPLEKYYGPIPEPEWE
jgi:hypothetical protein